MHFVLLTPHLWRAQQTTHTVQLFQRAESLYKLARFGHYLGPKVQEKLKMMLHRALFGGGLSMGSRTQPAATPELPSLLCPSAFPHSSTTAIFQQSFSVAVPSSGTEPALHRWESSDLPGEQGTRCPTGQAQSPGYQPLTDYCPEPSAACPQFPGDSSLKSASARSMWAFSAS